MLEQLTIDHFKGRIGERFLLEGRGGQIELRLVQTREAPQALFDENARLPFSLVFQGPGDRHLEASLYNLRHDRIGLLEGVFVTPVIAPPPGPPGEGNFIEAIFN